MLEDWKGEISKIEKKYTFKKGFDLFEKLRSVPTNIAMRNLAVKNFPRLALKKKQIQKLKEKLSNLQDCLRNTASDVKRILAEMPEEVLTHSGVNIKMKNNNWNLNNFENDLEILYTICLYAIHKIPRDSGGVKPSSVSKNAIFNLAGIFHEGTGKEPTCGWSDIDGRHIGEFYEFLIDVEPILRDLNIDLTANTSVGIYAVEMLGKYRNTLNQLEEMDVELGKLLKIKDAQST